MLKKWQSLRVEDLKWQCNASNRFFYIFVLLIVTLRYVKTNNFQDNLNRQLVFGTPDGATHTALHDELEHIEQGEPASRGERRSSAWLGIGVLKLVST